MPVLRPILLMTRPAEASERFVTNLNPDIVARIDVAISPLIRISFRTARLDLAGFRGVIFSSATGVRAALNAGKGPFGRAFCVGPATTQAAKQAGWDAQQSGQDASSLVATLLRDKPDVPLLHIRGHHARGDIAQTLSKQGLTCEEVVLYDQEALPLSSEVLSAVASDAPIVAPVFSPRTAALLGAQLPDRPIRCAALSQAVADELSDHSSWSVDVASSPDAQAMRALVEKLLQTAMPG